MPRLDEREVLVTGGAGFIGSHLVEALLLRGCYVHVVDDLSSGCRENLQHLAGQDRLRLTVAAVDDPEVADEVCRGAGRIFHLAGMVGVQRLANAPLEVMQKNLHCTEQVLEAAARHRVPILITSSSEVYGQGPVPFVESAPIQPGATEGLRGGYACAKAMGEWMAMAHHKQSGLPVVVARLFNTVGPRQSAAYGMVLPRFVAQARRGETLTVFGSGEQTRCFAAVEEVSAALVELLVTPAAHGRVVNVGSEREVTVARLAEIVRSTFGCDVPIARVPLEEVFPRGFYDPPRRVPCLTRLREAIGWVPERPIEQIVAGLMRQDAALPRPAVDAALGL
jgi:UDP-glucose 4-epimerase